MRSASPLSLLLLTLLVGCAAPNAQTPGVRLLTSEAPQAQAVPEADAAPSRAPDVIRPRIGAPGGSGAGSRRVAPAAAKVQSGKDTVGALPAGAAGAAGPFG